MYALCMSYMQAGAETSEIMSYVYLSFESGLWTVGFYRPDGKWEPESDHSSWDEAAKRVAWLNGGKDSILSPL